MRLNRNGRSATMPRSKQRGENAPGTTLLTNPIRFTEPRIAAPKIPLRTAGLLRSIALRSLKERNQARGLLARGLLASMRVFNSLLWAILPIWCLAAKKGKKTSPFDYYQSQFLSSSGPLKFDDSIFDELTTTPRNYTVVTQLTALEQRFGCEVCRQFAPEWSLLAKSWAKGDRKGETRYVFGTLDFLEGKGTFQKVCDPHAIF